jgi:hypothetical protein
MADRKGQGITAAVVARAMKDAAFRDRLVKNPKAAIEQETGTRLPANVEIRVLEETERKVHVVLPPAGDQDVLQRIVSRATIDADFRRQLIANPRAAIQNEAGVTIPGDVDLQVIEETETTKYIILPTTPLPAAGELSDQQLEKVAGGGGCFLTTVGNTDCFNLKTDCCASQASTQAASGW